MKTTGKPGQPNEPQQKPTTLAGLRPSRAPWRPYRTSGRGDATPIPPAPPFPTVWVHGRRRLPHAIRQAGGGMPHPSPRTPLSDRMGSWSVGICRMLLSDQRAGGCHTHPPLHPPFLPYGFMGRGRLPHVAVRQAGGGMPHPFPPAPSFPTALVPGPHVKQMQDRRAARAGQQTNIKPLAANNV